MVHGTSTAPSAQKSHGPMAWVVVFAAALYFFFEFIQMNMFNALDPYLMQAFHIDALGLGKLSANYFYGNVLFLFIAGMVLDRFSTKRLIITAMLVSIICAFGFSATSTFWLAGLFRFITGLAAAFCFLSCVRLASRWFPPNRMALAIGGVVTFAMLGGLAAQTPMTLLAQEYGWRMALRVDAIIGVILLVIISFCVRDFPAGHKAEFDAQEHAVRDASIWSTIKQVTKNSQNWLGGIYTCLMNLPVMLLGGIWGAPYLTHVRHLSRVGASTVTSMIFLGLIIGCPIIGWYSDKISRRKTPMIWGAALSIFLGAGLILWPQLNEASLIVIFLLIGFITSTQVISYPLIAESNSLNITGTAEGLASTIIMAGGIMQVVFSWVLQWHWNHIYIKHIAVYSPSNYNTAMWIIPIAFAVSLIMALVIKETYGKQFKHLTDR